MRYTAVLVFTALLVTTCATITRAQGLTATVTAVGNYPSYSGTPPPGIVENGAYVIQGNDGNLYGTSYYGGTSNFGTIFKMTTSGDVTILHSFAGGVDGAYPLSAPIQISDGTIFGTTTGDGIENGASIYSLSPSGDFSTIYSFPISFGNARVIYGSDGNLYGVTEGSNTIFQLTLTGALTLLYSLNNSSDILWSILQGTDGNFYGYSSSTIFELTPGGTFTTLHELSDPPDGERVTSLIQGADNNLYGTTAAGGATATAGTIAAGTVFRITTGGVFTVLHTFLSQAYPEAQPVPPAPAGLLQGQDGNYFGWTVGSGYVSGQDGGLFQMTPAGTVTPLYDFGANDGVGYYDLSLIQAADGSFYGTTEFLGPALTSEGVVFHAVVHASTPPPIPAPPTNLTAIAGDSQIMLSWNVSAGATSYRVYRGTTSAGEGTTAYELGITSPFIADTGLTDGITYYYTVAAEDSAGTSAQSAEASATPRATLPPIPPPPTGLSATAGDGIVRLSWNPVIIPQAYPYSTSFNVYRSTTSGDEGTTPYKSAITESSFTDTGLTDGTTYYYTVAAVNPAGISAQCSEVPATPMSGGSGPPPPPPLVVATFAPGLQMISAPVYDSGYSLDQIFNASNVILAVWDPSESIYVMSPTSPADTIVPGQGYWVRFSNTTELVAAGTETDPTQPFAVSLSAGWNMIGDPYADTDFMSGAAFSTVSGGSVSAQDAVASGLVGSRVYTYQPGDTQYEAQPTANALLNAFEGYWLYAGQDCTMTLNGAGGSTGPPTPGPL